MRADPRNWKYLGLLLGALLIYFIAASLLSPSAPTQKKPPAQASGIPPTSNDG